MHRFGARSFHIIMKATNKPPERSRRSFFIIAGKTLPIDSNCFADLLRRLISPHDTLSIQNVAHPIKVPAFLGPRLRLTGSGGSNSGTDGMFKQGFLY
jgi:hypothetical protein